MTGRTRKLSLAGLVVGGSFLFAVGFAGAQAPVKQPTPKVAHHDNVDAGVYTGTGSDGCGDHGEATTAVDPSDF